MSNQLINNKKSKDDILILYIHNIIIIIIWILTLLNLMIVGLHDNYLELILF